MDRLRELIALLSAPETRAAELIAAAALAVILRQCGANLGTAVVISVNVGVALLSVPFLLMATLAFSVGYRPPVYVALGIFLLVAAVAGALVAAANGNKPLLGAPFLVVSQVVVLTAGVAVLVAEYVQFFVNHWG